MLRKRPAIKSTLPWFSGRGWILTLREPVNDERIALMLQLLIRRIECPVHEGTFYDITQGEVCPKCNSDNWRLKEIEAAMNGKDPHEVE